MAINHTTVTNNIITIFPKGKRVITSHFEYENE